MPSQFLLLWFEAPLQSWGADSRFGRRDSLPFPTKSGVTGLILCAMGASGEQTELLARLADLRQTVISYLRQDGGTQREPLLQDFHMVGSGYDEKHPWQTLHIPKTVEGKKAVGGGSKMTYRYYLQDAKFAAIVEVPGDLAPTMANALQNPTYDLYLGRKNCVPTDFVYRGVFPDERAALDAAAILATEKKLREEFRVVPGETDGETMTLNDIPVQFGIQKVYRDRRVTRLQA